MSTKALVKASDNIKLLDAKIKEMKDIETSTWVTSGKITMIGGTLDIRTETSIERLVQGYANVSNSAERMASAYGELGITSYPVTKIDGASKDEWRQDILLRIKIIQQKDTLDKLKDMKHKWEELMDKEDRKAALADEMAAFLGS